MAEERERRSEGGGRRESRGGGGGGGRRFGGGRFGRRPGGRFGGGRRRGCPFCKEKVAEIDYKNADQLRYYLTDRGKIKARRKNSTCARHQRRLALAIKRARHLALLPFATEGMRG